MARVSQIAQDLGGASPPVKFEMRQGERVLFPIRWSPGVLVDGSGRPRRSENPHDITNWGITAEATFVTADYENTSISDFERLASKGDLAAPNKVLTVTTEPTLGIAYVEFPEDFYEPKIDFDKTDDIPAAVVYVKYNMKDTFKSRKILKQPIVVLFRPDERVA